MFCNQVVKKYFRELIILTLANRMRFIKIIYYDIVYLKKAYRKARNLFLNWCFDYEKGNQLTTQKLRTTHLIMPNYEATSYLLNIFHGKYLKFDLLVSIS